MTWSVLVVCSANICRSPMAARLLQARGDLDVTSAGTAALVGHPIDRASAQALRELGVDPGEHRARQLTPAMVGAADLVLTATVRHRDEIGAVTGGAAAARTFTLREFARLAGAPGPPADLAAVLTSVDARRAHPTPSLDDIGDPFAAPYAQMRACAEQISTAVDAVVAALTAIGPG